MASVQLSKKNRNAPFVFVLVLKVVLMGRLIKSKQQQTRLMASLYVTHSNLKTSLFFI